MKKIKKNLITAFVLFVFIGLHSASAQTPTTHRGNIFVATQAQVDALRTSLTAGATRIEGNVTIGPPFGTSDITDLSPLAAITEITGGVTVQFNNPRLRNLIGLNQLQTIGGSFVVGGSQTFFGNLTSLGDFTALQTIGGGFEVINNATLTSLGDFPALQSIGGGFEVSGNRTLTSPGDFPTLQTIGGGFEVINNDVLISLGAFPMLAGIGSSDGISVPSTGTDEDNVSILVEGNDLLQDCCVLTEFLSGATSAVSGQVFIGDNALGCSSTTQVNCDPFLQVDQKIVFIAKTATESTLNLFSRQHWQLSKPNMGAEWITNIAASGGNSDASSITGENHASITITTIANPNDAGRSTTLTLTAMDMSGNALTDPAPITIPFTQSGTTHRGNVLVRTQAEVDALSLTAGATRIEGNVTIGPATGMSDITDLSPLAAITEITENVIVQGNPRLRNLMGLNQLQSIGIDFFVSSNAALTSLGNFSALQTIGGRFSVFGNNDLLFLGGFPVLQSIGGDFYVEANNALIFLGGFPVLQSIGNEFLVEDNNALTSLGDFSALQSIGGRFYVEDNIALTSLGDFSALQSIDSDFYVEDNAVLTSLGDFSALQSIDRDFLVSSNAVLTSLGNFSALQSIGGRFAVILNTALTSLGDFPALQSIGRNFSVFSNDLLTSLGDFPALQSIGGVFGVESNTALTSLGDFSALQSIGGNFRVLFNAALTSLGDFSALQSISGYFHVEDNASLTSLGGFPMLASIGSTDRVFFPNTRRTEDNVSILVEENGLLQDCCVLTAFLSGATSAVSGQVFINENATGCSSTTEVNCDPFLQVDQKIVFIAKTATESTLNLFSRQHWQFSKPNTGAEWITNIAASGGNSDASSITGENHASITITTRANPNDAGRSTTLSLRAMDMAGNALTDPAPITIPFTQLGTTHTGDVSVTTQAEVNALRNSLTAGATRIEGNVTIGSRFGTSDIFDLSPLAAITEITGNVVVQRNTRLRNLMGLNQLQTIGGSFYVEDNASLPSLGDLSALATIGGSFHVEGNRTLTSLGNLSALATIGGSFYVEGNRTLTSLGNLSALQSIGGSFHVEGNRTLTSLGRFPMLTSIGSDQNGVSISVRFNELLQDCCVLTEFLSGGTNAISGQVFISDNATGCRSEAEINPCGSQTIAFTSDGAGNVGVSITLVATATSTLPVTFAITDQVLTSGTGDVATLAAGVLTLVSPGEVTITATQAGGDSEGITYLSATEMQIITVSKGTQTIEFRSPAVGTINTEIELAATASSGLDVTFAVTNQSPTSGSGDVVTLAGNGTTLSLTGAGTATITATQAGNANYAAATQTQTITVSAIPLTTQTIMFTSPTTGTVGTPITLVATATSMGTVTFAVTEVQDADGNVVTGANADDVVTLSGSTLTLLAAGTVTVTASQAGGDIGGTIYATATQTQVITIMPMVVVLPATQTIAFASPAVGTINTDIELAATASSGLDVTFAVTNQSPTSGSGEVVTLASNGTTLSLTGAGTATITATQAGNANYAAATQEQTITVSAIPLISQTIMFASPDTGTVGTPITLAAMATSTGAVTFAITEVQDADGNVVTGGDADDVATLASSTLTLLAAGTVTVTASQAGGDIGGTIYAHATQTQVITVSKGTQTITFNEPSGDITGAVGDDIALAAITDAMGLFVTFSIDPATGVATLTDDGAGTGSLTLDGAGMVTVIASQTGNGTYAAATDVTRTITVEATSTVLGIEAAADGFVLYPNPTSGKLHFSEQVGEFRLYGIEGRLLETRKNVRSADLSARPAGLYFVEVVRDGRSVRWRVVRE